MLRSRPRPASGPRFLVRLTLGWVYCNTTLVHKTACCQSSPELPPGIGGAGYPRLIREGTAGAARPSASRPAGPAVPGPGSGLQCSCHARLFCIIIVVQCQTTRIMRKGPRKPDSGPGQRPWTSERILTMGASAFHMDLREKVSELPGGTQADTRSHRDVPPRDRALDDARRPP
jgi:hypothetical protein